MPRENSDLPSLENLNIASDALRSCRDHVDQLDQVLFSGFTRPRISALHVRLQRLIEADAPLALQDWDDLSLLLRSMSLSLAPFPELTEKYQPPVLYAAITEIAEYALNLPYELRGKVKSPRGRAHEL